MLRKISAVIHADWRRVIQYRIKQLAKGLNLIWLVVFMGLTWLVALYAPILEFYITYLTKEEIDWVAVLSAFGLVIIFSIQLFLMARWLPQKFDPENYRAEMTGFPRLLNTCVSFVIGIVPWLIIYSQISGAEEILSSRLAVLREDKAYSGAGDIYGYRVLQAKLLVCFGALFVSMLLIGWYKWSRKPDPLWTQTNSRVLKLHSVVWWLRILIVAIIVIITIYLLFAPSWYGNDNLSAISPLSISQQIGPIATLVAVFIAFCALAYIFAAGTSWILAPDFLAVALLFAVGGLFYSTNKPNLQKQFKVADTQECPAVSPENRSLEKLFVSWLKARNQKAGGGEQNAEVGAPPPYPVFIFASQGGGAFAAAHSAQILASLQDEDPRFIEHVFAVSGVSGGAVGPTLFSAVNASRNGSTAKKSEVGFGKGPMASILREVLTQRHAAPLIAQIIGIIPSRLIPYSEERGDRSNELKQSYMRSLENAVKSDVSGFKWRAADCGLRGGYRSNWSKDVGGGPALILNATSVEEGQLVAFSPFDLKADSNGLLSSFSEWFKRKAPHISTLDAALVSARFPGILPAFSFKTKEGMSNFVDGGYADASGATTAHVLYKALKKIASKENFNIDLKLVIIASRNEEKKNSKGNGTRMVDTLAPVYAMLRVRDQQAMRAVALVEAAIGKNKDDAVEMLELPQNALDLPLAWSISKVTYDAIAKSIGKPDNCGIATGNDIAGISREKTKIVAASIASNSCVLQRILAKLETPDALPVNQSNLP